MKYFLPDTTFIVSNKSSTTLRTGTLHQDEVSISHTTSTSEFLEKFEELLRVRQLNLKDGDPAEKDFDILVSLNMLRKIETTGTKTEFRHLTLISETLPERNKALIEAAGQKAMVFEKIFTTSYVEKILSDRGADFIVYDNDLLKNLCKEFHYFHVVAPMTELLRIRAFNRSMKFYKIPFTLSLLDNQHTYFMSGKHGYTGCFECLERHIISRFAGTVKDYAEQAHSAVYEKSDFVGEDLYLVGALLREINNIDHYKVTALYGNVIYFNFINYEYSFDVNRVQGSCPSCATLNNVKFKEQYIRSCNIVEQLLKESELSDAGIH